MKQQNDTRTLEAFPLPARRGRKPTGEAKSSAQRVAEHKRRKLQAEAANFAELESLRDEVRCLRADNAALAAELHRLTAPKAQVLAGLAVGLAGLFDELGVSHELQGRA